MKRLSLILFLLFSTTIAIACDGSSITLISGPTIIAGGRYSVTIRLCTTRGGSSCANGNTGNFWFGVMGTTYDYAASASTVTSPHTAAVYGQVTTGPAGYTGMIGYTNTVTWFAVISGFGGCTTLCTNITLVFNGYPTRLTALALEGGDSPAAGCAGETIVFPVLPITLTSFDAILEDGNVKIDWITQSEINNDYFTIERSLDGVNYEEIATVKGAGNSSSLNNYTIVDEQPIEGVNYYRLKQTDFNGNYEYFNAVAVNNRDRIDELNFYPNPITSDLNISFNSLSENRTMALSIFNITGVKILEKNIVLVKGLNKISLKFNDFSKGIYFVTIESSGESHKAKFIKN